VQRFGDDAGQAASKATNPRPVGVKTTADDASISSPAHLIKASKQFQTINVPSHSETMMFFFN
jgi:hypothetical protein